MENDNNDNNDNNELATIPQGTATVQPVETGLSIFDSGAFEKMLSIAEALSRSSLIPETIRGKTPEETAANCLLVVEQSSRWGLSPFGVLQCASVVHQKLMWEGKLISAVVDAQLGIRLKYEYSGEGENRRVVVIGKFDDEDEPRTIEGDVSQWKTTGKGSPWSDPKNYDRQLSYRGAREWARRHAPAVMLGVVTDDEQIESGMVNVTNGRNGKQFVREEPLDPAKATPEAVEQELMERYREKFPTVEDDRPREVRDCDFKAIGYSEKDQCWLVKLHNGQRAADMETTSKGLAGVILSMTVNQRVRATFIPSETGRPELVDLVAIKGEGELI